MSDGHNNVFDESTQGVLYPGHNFENAERSRQKVWAYPENPHESERNAVAILRRNGVYAVPGRWSEWKYTDIVAFGCVRIESRYATLKTSAGKEQFQWRVAPSHHPEDGMRGDIVMLIADYGKQVEVALFKVSHAIFYRENNALKKGITYKPIKATQSREHRFGTSLTRDIWLSHRNNFNLVFEVLNDHIQTLKG